MRQEGHKKKILLGLLPFWTPLIPPMGIACLKGFLTPHGCRVKTVDANVKEEFKQIYDRYFEALGKFIPGDKQGNFYNIGNDVLQNHMTAHLHEEHERKNEYIQLVKLLIEKNFFYRIADSQVNELNKIINEFYRRLERYLFELLDKENPDILGLTVYKGTLAASLFAFKITREKYPHIKTIMGGGIFADHLALDSPNFEFFLEKTSYIDHIVVGEGEALFLELLKNEFSQSKKVYTLKDTGGNFLDVSSVGIPDFSDFHLENYTELAAYASRSCPYQCGFCAETVIWGRYRKKTAVQVAKELVQLYKIHRSQLFLMTDSLLNPIITDLSKELLHSEFRLYWDGYLRADHQSCDPDKALLWRRSGFYRARLGLESGSQRVLKLMNKKITPAQIKAALSSLASVGIKTTTYWVMGYPGETEEDFQETLRIIEETKDDIYEAECNPFRYFWSGQVNSDQWMKQDKPVLIYPENARDLLILQTWTMANREPSREEIYSRVNRFVQHCSRLGIPNPYSWHDIYHADERWQKLQPNAVPPLMAFKEKTSYIDECKQVEKLLWLKKPGQDEGDFAF